MKVRQMAEKVKELNWLESSNNKKEGVEDWTYDCIKDILELLSTIFKVVQKLTKKRKGTSEKGMLHVKLKLIRVSAYMKDSFSDFEKYIKNQSGPEVESILIPSKKDNVIYDSDDDEPQNLSRSPLLRRTPMKKLAIFCDSLKDDFPFPNQRKKSIQFSDDKMDVLQGSDKETKGNKTDQIDEMTNKKAEISDERSSNKMKVNEKMESVSSKSERINYDIFISPNTENIVEAVPKQPTELKENSLTIDNLQENKPSDQKIPGKNISSLERSNDTYKKSNDTSLDTDNSESNLKKRKGKSNSRNAKSKKNENVSANKFFLPCFSDDSKGEMSYITNNKVYVANQEAVATTKSQEESTIENIIVKNSSFVCETDVFDDQVRSPLKFTEVDKEKGESNTNHKVIPVDKEESASSNYSLKSGDEKCIAWKSLLESNEEMINLTSRSSISGDKSVNEIFKAQKCLLKSDSNEGNDEFTSLTSFSKAVTMKCVSNKKWNKVNKKMKNGDYISWQKSIKGAKEKQRLDLGYVKLYRLDSEILKDLENCSISIADYPHLLNNNLNGTDVSTSESDEEFKSILMVKVTEKTGAKEEDSKKDCDSDCLNNREEIRRMKYDIKKQKMEDVEKNYNNGESEVDVVQSRPSSPTLYVNDGIARNMEELDDANLNLDIPSHSDKIKTEDVYIKEEQLDQDFDTTEPLYAEALSKEIAMKVNTFEKPGVGNLSAIICEESSKICLECDNYLNQEGRLSLFCSTCEAASSKKNIFSSKKLAPFRCSECKCSFFQKSKLERHTLIVHENVKPYKCEECGSEFRKKYNLSHHVMSVHKALKPFKCDQCDREYNSKYSLKKHIGTVHEKLKPFKCDQCGREYFAKYDLKKHIETVHEKLKLFTCSECDAAFTQNSHFRQHIITIHKKIGPWKCSECEICYFNRSSLSKHVLLVHRQVKHFQCTDCEKTFFRKGDLLHHVKYVHKNVKNFICTLCDSAFILKYDLFRHVRAVHEKIKPYRCSECDKTFSEKSSLSRHILKVHQKNKH